MTDTAVEIRRHEIVAEHMLFKLAEYVEQRQPGLLDFIEASLDRLGEPAYDATRDDTAVREITRRVITGARHEVAG